MILVIKLFMKLIIFINGKKILDTSFDYIEVCIKDEDNEDIIMKDLFQIGLYIS